MEVEVKATGHEQVVTNIVSPGCGTNCDRIGKVNFKANERPA